MGSCENGRSRVQVCVDHQPQYIEDGGERGRTISEVIQVERRCCCGTRISSTLESERRTNAREGCWRPCERIRRPSIL